MLQNDIAMRLRKIIKGTEDEFYVGNTIDVLGTKRFEQLMGGGTNNNNQIAGSVSERTETIHKKDSSILIRVQNKAGSAKDISIYALWYEE